MMLEKIIATILHALQWEKKTLNELLSGAGLVSGGELRSAKHFMKEIFQVLLHRVAAADWPDCELLRLI